MLAAQKEEAEEEKTCSNEKENVWKLEYDKREINLQAQCIDQEKDGGSLYLSSIHVAHCKQDLTHLQIEYVVTITHDQSLSAQVPIEDSKHKLHICINDKVEAETMKVVDQQFPIAAQWIYEKLHTLKKIVLVHCASGISRSSSLIIWYLMQYREMNLRDAFAYVFHKRPVILPNDSLFAALQQKDNALFKSVSMSRNDYNAYSLCCMLRFLGVDLKQCQTVLQLCGFDVMKAAQQLQEQSM